MRKSFDVYAVLQVTSMEEHHELKVEQFQVAIDPTNNTEYIQFKRSDQR